MGRAPSPYYGQKAFSGEAGGVKFLKPSAAGFLYPPSFINSVQTRCIVKALAQKSPLLWRFSGGF